MRRSIRSTGVLFKLIIFSLSLGIVPITSYFASEKYIWNGAFLGADLFHSARLSPDLLAFIGNSTFAAITAVVAANVVLVAYIISSVRDDQVERKATKPLESRKDR
jgi:uncharacterized membrane protein YjgN (DUF898 family)